MSAVPPPQALPKEAPQFTSKVAFPLKLIKDKSHPQHERIAALTFYYGCLASQVYCRNPMTGKPPLSKCKCLFNHMLTEDGQPNHAVLYGTAQVVVNDFYDAERMERYKIITDILQASQAIQQRLGPDELIRFPMPVKPKAPPAPTREGTAAAAQERLPQQPPQAEYLVCQWTIMTIFNLGRVMWDTCKKSAAKGTVPHHHLKGKPSNRRVKGRSLDAAHAFFQKLCREQGYDPSKNTNQDDSENDDNQAPPPPTVRVPFSARGAYKRFCHETGYTAICSKEGNYTINEREDWPSDQDRPPKMSKHTLDRLRKEHYPYIEMTDPYHHKT